MRIMATHVSLNSVAIVCGLISGYGFACEFPAVGTCFAVLCVALLAGGAVVIHDAFRHASAETVEWSTRWGSEVGSAPRLLRTLLLALESRLRLKAWRGASMEDRTERVLDAMATRQTTKQVERFTAEQLH